MEEVVSMNVDPVTEFIMTYGWAILVVLVAIGALAYFGFMDGFNPNVYCDCDDVNMSYLKSVTSNGIKYYECGDEYYVISSTSIDTIKVSKVYVCWEGDLIEV